MPTTARANREADDAEAGAAQAEKRMKVRVSLQVVSLLQTILQHAAETFADKTVELSDVLSPINSHLLREINWHSNPGNVIEALLHACGLGWSTCGKKLWRRADPTKVVEWRPPQKGRSLRPAAPRATTLDAIDDIDLQHDAHSGAAGSRGAQRAAESRCPDTRRRARAGCPASSTSRLEATCRHGKPWRSRSCWPYRARGGEACRDGTRSPRIRNQSPRGPGTYCSPSSQCPLQRRLSASAILNYKYLYF